MDAIEINGILYQDREFGRIMEWARLENKRVKIKRFLEGRPKTGYIRKKDKDVERGIPGSTVLVYNRRSQVERDIVEDYVEWIEFSNKAEGGRIWSRRNGAEFEVSLPLEDIGGKD